MDPVTIVGFAASLATLAAVLVDSSKTLYNLRDKLHDAPDDVRRLVRQFKIFEGLLEGIQARIQEHEDLGLRQGLQELWEGSAEQMHRDMEDFKVIVSRLHRLLEGPTISSKLIRLRIRHFFNEDTVAKYQRQISAHIETLTMIQIFISE